MRYSGGTDHIRRQVREGQNGREHEPMMTSPDLLGSYATANGAVPLQVQDQYARRKKVKEPANKVVRSGTKSAGRAA